MKELQLNVKGIECGGCENRIKNAIKELKNVKEVTAYHETGQVNIIMKKEITKEIKSQIVDIIEKIGFEVEK